MSGETCLFPTLRLLHCLFRQYSLCCVYNLHVVGTHASSWWCCCLEFERMWALNGRCHHQLWWISVDSADPLVIYEVLRHRRNCILHVSRQLASCVCKSFFIFKCLLAKRDSSTITPTTITSTIPSTIPFISSLTQSVDISSATCEWWLHNERSSM